MQIRRSIYNFFSHNFLFVVTTVLSYLVTPAIVRNLGASAYGTYWTILEWAGYLALIEMGINEATIPGLSKAHNTKKREDTRSHLVVAFRAHLVLAPIKLLAASVLAYSGVFLVRDAGLEVSHIRTAFLIAGSASVLSVLNPVRALIEINQKGYIIGLWLSLQAGLSALLTYLFAINGGGLVGQMAALILSQIPFYIFLTVSIHRAFPGIFREVFNRKVSAETQEQIWRLNGVAFAANICGRLSLMSNKIIIGIFLGPVAVANFHLTLRLVNLAQNVLGSIGNATWAGMGALHFNGKDEVFRERMIELSRILMIAALLLLGPILIFNGDFIHLWVGYDLYAGRFTTLLGGFSAVTVAYISMWSYPFSVTGLFSVLLPQYVAFTFVSVTVGAIATKTVGLPGPLIGTTVAACMTSLWVIPLKLQKHFGISATGLLRAVLLPVLQILPVLILIKLVTEQVPVSETIWDLLLRMGVSFSVLVLCLWMFVFTKSERAAWRNRLKRI